ncbi:SIMPL domain-containing protein [Geodermatophilus sp. SYSU D00758]
MPEVAVRGEALLVADPEVADLTVSVQVRAPDRQRALERCTARQGEVTRLLDAAGDAVEDRRTAHLALLPEDVPGRPGCRASLTTRVTVPPGAVADLAAALGRLEDVAVTGPHWRLRPDSPVHEQARLAAVRDAVVRARHYAAAFGARLTALLEVADAGQGGPRVAVPLAAVARFGSDEPRLDLTPAPQEVFGAVEVRFAMSPPDPEVFRA